MFPLFRRFVMLFVQMEPVKFFFSCIASNIIKIIFEAIAKRKMQNGTKQNTIENERPSLNDKNR